MNSERKIEIEVHIKNYGVIKGTTRPIGLETRLIIIHPRGNSEIKNFDYHHQAHKYIKETYGELKDGKFNYVNLFKKYGNRGYKW